MKTYNVKYKHSICSSAFLKNEFWLGANAINDFSYPWDDNKRATMQFKALYDSVFFYFLFEVKVSNVLTYVKNNHKSEVKKSDRVELFFMTQNGMNPYYGLEMDALCRVFDYEAKLYRKFNEKWTWPKGHLFVHVDKTIIGYNLYGKISLNSLMDLGIFKDGKMHVGVYRGHCKEFLNSTPVLKWISWVNPKSIKPDFHIPTSFGVFRFADL